MGCALFAAPIPVVLPGPLQGVVVVNVHAVAISGSVVLCASLLVRRTTLFSGGGGVAVAGLVDGRFFSKIVGLRDARILGIVLASAGALAIIARGALEPMNVH